MRSLAVPAVSLVSALGDGTDAALAALRDRHGALRPCVLPDEGLAEGAGGYVGCVGNAEAGIVTGGLSRFDCRNNRLANLAMHADGFAERVAFARERYGPGRIAVILGTSTSGILSTEQAYRARDVTTGALPDAFDYSH